MTQAPYMPPQAKSYLLPVALWLAAFVCALSPVNALQLEFSMAAVVLSFAWMIAMLFRDIRTGWNVPRSFVLMIAGAFWTLVLCSVFWSAVKPVSIVVVCYFSLMPLTFFGGVMAARGGYFKSLAWPLALVFAVLSVWAMVQFFFLDAYFAGQARHPLADPSSLGALLGLAFFCALGLSVSGRPVRERAAGAVLSALLLCGIFSTVARGPVLALLPGLLVFTVLLWPRVKGGFKWLLPVLLAGGIFLALPHPAGKSLDLGERLSKTLEAGHIEKTLGGEGGELRPLIWASTIEMIREAPVLGRGIGTFFLYYPEYRKAGETDGVYMAHNDPLQFWAELGFLGPLLFYAFVIACTVRTVRALKRLPADHPDRVVVASIFAALTALVIHAHVSFNHYNLTILMIEGLLLSVWFLATGRALDERTRIVALPDNLPHNLDKLLIAMPFLMMSWLFLSVTGGEYFASRARDALFRQDMNAFADDINQAGRVSMGLNYRAYIFAVNVPLAILEDRKSTLGEEQQKKLFDQVEDYMNKVTLLNPRSPEAYYYMAKVQSLVSSSVVHEDLQEPEALYKEALHLDPMHLGARLALLKLYEEQGKDVQVRLALMEQIYRNRFNTEQALDYYGALAKLYLESGNSAKVREVLTRANNFKKRSDYSLNRQNMSLPQAIMGGDDALHGR